MADNRRFESARLRVLTELERQRHGIGMQKEKKLHAIFKGYEDPNSDHQEIPVVGSYIADIFNGSEIVEIQNGNFGKMRDKLCAYLPQYPVRIVYPIPHCKWITWIDPDTGEQRGRRRSPRKGTIYDAVPELFRIRSYLEDPHLTIDLCLTDMVEYRLQDGWGRDGKRGSHRYDRIPTAIVHELRIRDKSDYLAFVPPDLPEPFTAAQMAAAAGQPGRAFSDTALLLTELGILNRIGKRGHAYLYRIGDAFREADATKKLTEYNNTADHDSFKA